MLKYLIVPRWLFGTFTTFKVGKPDLLDFQSMVTILSPKELTFYIRCNTRSYNDFFINKNTNRLLTLLKSNECENQIKSCNGFSNYIDVREKKLSNDTDFTEFLINNPIYPLKKNVDNRKLYLEAEWIDNGVLGFIPTTRDLELKDYSIRRDIYKVMKRQMSSDDILQSPIFGI